MSERLIMATVTRDDVTEAEPLKIITDGLMFATLECDGLEMVVDVVELRAALKPGREVRAA